jgi:hypothetical protein
MDLALNHLRSQGAEVWAIGTLAYVLVRMIVEARLDKVIWLCELPMIRTVIMINIRRVLSRSTISVRM